MSKIFCKNCEQHFEGNFCPNCGQSSHEHRINAHYFIHDIPHSVFHIDGIFLSTLKGLFVRPGAVVSGYLEGKRVKYFRPFAYVMVMTAISTFLVKFFLFLQTKLVHHFTPNFVIPTSENFFEHYFSIFIFLMIPFASLVTWIFFIKKKYNFWEHFLANTYIAAQLNFIWIFIHLINTVTIFFVKKYVEIDFGIFMIFFMMFFLYIYGWVFGYLMSPFYNKKWILIVLLTVMNLALYFVYSTGFRITGIM